MERFYSLPENAKGKRREEKLVFFHSFSSPFFIFCLSSAEIDRKTKRSRLYITMGVYNHIPLEN